MEESETTYLIIGYPGLVARAVLRELAKRGASVRVEVLVGDRSGADEVRAFAEREGCEVRAHIGSTVGLDYGLPGAAYVELLERVDRVIWCAETKRLPATLETSLPVRAAAELVEFARARGDRRRHAVRGAFLSSLLVFGNHRGVALESDLKVGQSFGNLHEESLATAEAMVEHHDETSGLSILRAAPVIGDAVDSSVDTEGVLAELVRRLRRGPALITASCSFHPTLFTTSDAVARALLMLADHDGESARRVHFLPAEPPTDADFLRAVAERMDLDLELKAPANRVLPPHSPLHRIRSPERRAWVGWPLRFDVSRAREVLPDLPESPFEEYLEGLVETCQEAYA